MSKLDTLRFEGFMDARNKLIPRAVNGRVTVTEAELEAYMALFPPEQRIINRVMTLDGYQLILKEKVDDGTFTMNINSIKPSHYKLTAKDAIRSKKEDGAKLKREKTVRFIKHMLDIYFKDGELPYCMDNEHDRAMMAEWFYDRILPL